MNRAPHPLHALAAGLMLGATAVAQNPVDPPPWWRVNDNVTVSLYWDFNILGAPYTPTLAVVPGWYSSTVTAFAPTNVVQVAGLGPASLGIGLVQGIPQSGILDLTVDNDPYPDWIKIFWFQFDVLAGGGSSVVAEIEKSLNYKRAIVSQTSVPIGLGWERVTIEAQLIPQPDDEGIDWSFLSTGNAATIDNLYVSSKCVKPGPDETGDAFGDASGRINLTQATNGADCRGVAITQGPAPAFQRRIWVSTRAATAGALHQVVQLNIGGVQVGTTALPFNVATAPGGAMDLAVETVPSATIGSQQYVYALVDGRATPGGNVVLLAIDANTGFRDPARDVTLVGFPAVAPQPTNFGLAFDPSGELGAGTFWVSDQTGTVYEFRRNGTLINANTVSFGPNLTLLTGIGYDDTLGRFYGFSQMQQPTPTGPIQVNGVEWSGYDFQLTGNRFCGDLTLQNPGGPRGGVATGFEVYRRRNNPTSQLNMVCMVDTPNNPLGQQWLYEVAGPFPFGWSLLGRCDMRDSGPFHGVPFRGSTMEVRLHGVPNTLFAAMFLGFSNTTSPVGPLPLPLGAILGWGESVLSISPDVNTPLLLPTSPGEFVVPIAIPTTVPGYTPVFFQWLALDSGVQGFFAMSQAGKTVIYP